MNYENITDLKATFQDGSENPSGIAELAYLIPLSWFEDIKTPANPNTTAEGIVRITGNHVLKAGKTPLEVNPLFEKSGAASSLEGEILSKIYKSTVELFIPQVTAQNIGTVTAIKNYRFMVLFRRPDQETGFIQLGSKTMGVYVEAVDANFGTGPTGEPGIKITVGGYNKAPYYFYDGELPVAAAPGG